MSPMLKTLSFVAVAALLTVLALFSSPGAVEPAFFSDVGEEFFADFTDPDRATSLEIWGFDAETGGAVPFSVKKVKGTWQIPSHFDYPADAKDRMAKAAGLFVGLTKASVRSDRKEDHVAFGVVDPTEQSLETEGRGTRVTFKDDSGTVLADLILGNAIEGQEARYVRMVGKKRTYTAVIPADVSTKFEDWIERDLLKVASYDIDEVVFDNYSVDEARGVVVPGEKVTMAKDGADWKVADLAATEEVDQTKARDAVTTLTGLKIVDVRAKPEGLTAALERSQGISRELLMQSLQRKGYFVTKDKLYSNEGDLLVRTNKGVVYTLKFGEIVYGSEAAEASTANGAGAEEDKGDPSRRYLMVTAEFDASLLDAPAGTPLSTEHLDQRREARTEMQKIVSAVEAFRAVDNTLPASLAALTEGESPLLAELKQDPWGHDYVLVAKPVEPPPPGGDEVTETPPPAFAVVCHAADGAAGGEGENEDLASDAFAREDALRKVADDHAAYARKVEAGQTEAKSLTDRFGPWYYVIDAASFDKLHLSRSDLVTAKAAEPDAEEGK